MQRRRTRTGFTVCCLIALITLLPLSASASVKPDVEPEADALVRKMSVYMASLKQFTAELEAGNESLLDSGQKIMYLNRISVALRRPDRLYVHRQGAIRDQEIYYDGKKLTLYGRARNLYAEKAAPATIEEALDFAVSNIGLSAPGSDLFVPDIYSALMADVRSGIYLGKTKVDGVECHHVAFRSGEVDWQMWIEDGDRPLPRKYVITSKWLAAAPQYTVTIKKLDASVILPEDRFRFTPPQGASRIEFLSTAEAEAARKQLKKEVQP